MSVYDLIIAARQKNVRVYLEDPRRLITDYMEEKRTTEDYNGRQILELLQNVDDAKSSDAEIVLDSENCLLTISNIGEPFSVKGFESLLLANNSSKNDKRRFIGNKGLGFRSILNWADLVEVRSNGCQVKFSREIALGYVKSELSAVSEEIDNIRKEKRYTEDAFTYPILSFPRVEACKGNGKWTTVIFIHFHKEFRDDIVEQLERITPEVLLFVRSIRNLELNIDGCVKSFKSTCEVVSDCPFERTSIVVSDSDGEIQTSYRVFKRSGRLPAEYQEKNEKEDELFYEISIALDDDFENRDRSVYSFFKTDVQLPLPCIVHGSFDLDSARKQIYQTQINLFIVRKIARELLYVALFIQKDSESTNWNSFELLYLKGHISGALWFLGDYLKRYLENGSLYPCINDVYFPAEESVYYSESFREWVETGYVQVFPDLLKAKNIGDSIADLPVFSMFTKYKEEYFWKSMEELCSKDTLSMENRAEIIKLICEINVENSQNSKISALTDESGKVIGKDVCAYIPATAELKIPYFVEFRVVNGELLHLLMSALNASSGTDLCSKIGSFVDIKELKLSELVTRILQVSKNMASEPMSDEKDEIMKLAISSLFENYRKFENRSDFTNVEAFLKTREGSWNSAKQLYFSGSYTQNAEEYFGAVLPENRYLVDKSFWEIEDPGFDNFLRMLGASSYLKYKEGYLDFSDSDYYATEVNRVRYYENLYAWPPTEPVMKLDDIDFLLKLDASQLLVLINRTAVVKNALVRTKLQYDKRGSNRNYHVYTDNSYIAYQLKKVFSSVVISSGNADIDRLLDKSNRVDYGYLKKHGIDERTADIMLQQLGALGKLNNYSPFDLSLLILKMMIVYPDGKRAQSIYEFMFDTLKDQIGFPDGKIILACKYKNKVEYKVASEIFYCSSPVLPKSVIEETPILLFKMQEDESSVSKFFGVNILSCDSLVIDEDKLDVREELTAEFESYFESRKAFILASRLQFDRRLKASASEVLLDFKIKLVESGTFVYKNQEMELEPYDFLIKEDVAYIQVPSASISELIHTRDFLNACSDVLGRLFEEDNFSLKKTFRSVLKDNANDIRDDIIESEGEDFLQDCREMLGQNDTPESLFWNRILQEKNLESFRYINGRSLRDYIGEALNFVLPEGYDNVDFESFRNSESFNFVKSVCDQLEVKPEVCLPGTGLLAYHKRMLQNVVHDCKRNFRNHLWKKLDSLPAEKQEDRLNFPSLLNEYDASLQSIDMTPFAFVFEVDYKSLLVKWVKSEYGFDLNITAAEMPKGNDLYEIFKDLKREEVVEVTVSVASPVEGTVIAVAIADNNSVAPVQKKIVSIEPNKRSRENVSSSKKSVRNVTPTVSSRQRELGEEAEALVKRLLEAEECEYEARSSISAGVFGNDAEHYDFRYKPNGSAEWRYLEVKNVSRDSFILTAGELDFIFQEDHRNIYDLALVIDGVANIVQNHFAQYESKMDFLNRFGGQEVAYMIPFNVC